MQPSTILAFLASAVFAAAAPAAEAEAIPNRGPRCSQPGFEPSCCNGRLLGGALLGSNCDLLSVLGDTCSQQQACCKVNNRGNALLNTNLCLPLNL